MCCKNFANKCDILKVAAGGGMSWLHQYGMFTSFCRPTKCGFWFSVTGGQRGCGEAVTQQATLSGEGRARRACTRRRAAPRSRAERYPLLISLHVHILCLSQLVVLNEPKLYCSFRYFLVLKPTRITDSFTIISTREWRRTPSLSLCF